ncbi:response regulator transcription factor [Amygdalobacter indicium]|jgi:hypothetical protein|uniref:Stage 0 sporulation protein A homolog n=1 Tax=Amygdalobacter indicium TaxID=3029272 RepID=A0ABY8C5F1_9FIRM|nr:response regulator transcription factor [Amygdalobacter indicium]WEG34309.1 response regulator transcription factor [Amygdalobacter indicium]WEG35893.1 response regulator transcription factor [Amygdalobacter indicium]
MNDASYVKRALIIDDDANICELLRLYFSKDGFAAKTINNGIEAYTAFTEYKPDIVILDLMLPGKDGYDICREIRKTSSVPIIMLTARSETLDKVVGLELGADDYISKPFDAQEFMARVKAVLRRSNAPVEVKPQSDEKVTYHNFLVDKLSYTAIVNGVELDMPPKELELLFFLATHPNRVFTREQLLGQVWGYDFFGESRTVDVHVKRIRERIESTGGSTEWQIKTVWGVGYKFEVNNL